MKRSESFHVAPGLVNQKFALIALFVCMQDGSLFSETNLKTLNPWKSTAEDGQTLPICMMVVVQLKNSRWVWFVHAKWK